MLKEIKYGGYTAHPSDYSCPDGDLALSLNLINEDGGLRPIECPAPAAYLANGETILLIHKVTGQENYILLNSDKLYWMKRQSYYSSTKNSKEIDTKGTLSGYKTISAVGNTLCVSTAKGVEYILWKDGSYKYLGTKPPFLSIRFGCYMSGKLEAEGSVPGDVADGIKKFFNGYTPQERGGVPYSWNDTDKAYWHDAENAIMGKFLSEVADNVSTQGRVFQPFFIRYAYRLYDGSYSWHSVPILMLPMAVRPFIYVRLGKDEDGSEAVLFKLNVPYFTISYRVCGDVNLLKEWSDIVTGLDVFLSQPIYTYQQEEFFDRPVHLKAFFVNQGIVHRGGVSNTNKYLTGIYAPTVNGSYEERFITETDISNAPYYMFGFKTNEQFEDRLQYEHLFYKVTAFDLADIKAMSAMEDFPLDKVDLSNINTLETLPDDYNSHATILPGSLHAYNQRLIMTDVTMKPPVPFPTLGVSQALNASESTTPADLVRNVKVYTRINGNKCVSAYVQDEFVDPFPLGKVKPRYLYHPDPSAFMMEIYTTGETYRYNLKQHPYLNGAYWFGGITATPAAPIAEAESTTTTEVAVGNKVYLSQVNNPFLFPVESIVTIDCGRIFRLSTAAKALSQGQFGQFPLYAFTDDGVWALEVASTGVISARQPITRDVCLGEGVGITQIDSAVLFPTDRGIMLISGSQTQCLTDPVNALESLSLGNYKGFFNSFLSNASATSLLPSLTLLPADDFVQTSAMPIADADTSQPGVLSGILESFPISVVPFRTYIETCRMAYDYPHQHILVFNPSYGYFYVYSLKSQLWCMAHGRLNYAINSYPEALITDTRGRLLDFSAITGVFPKGALLSRPLKLDMPDILKTVSTVIQRGLFHKGKVQCILYGSRDLVNWHLVSSSRDHYMRGFSGTPYKYFRIAVVADIAPGESLYGASVEFQPRLTNRLR